MLDAAADGEDAGRRLDTLMRKACGVVDSRVPDASIVRAAAVRECDALFTLKTDFSTVRPHGRGALTLIQPTAWASRRHMFILAGDNGRTDCTCKTRLRFSCIKSCGAAAS